MLLNWIEATVHFWIFPEHFVLTLFRHTCENHTECIDSHLTALFNDLKRGTAHTYNITKKLGIDRGTVSQNTEPNLLFGEFDQFTLSLHGVASENNILLINIQSFISDNPFINPELVGLHWFLLPPPLSVWTAWCCWVLWGDFTSDQSWGIAGKYNINVEEDLYVKWEILVYQSLYFCAFRSSTDCWHTRPYVLDVVQRLTPMGHFGIFLLHWWIQRTMKTIVW